MSVISESELYLLSGPEDDFRVPSESMGKYLLDNLKRRDSDDIVNVDAFTKKGITCRKLLEDSIKATAVLKNLGSKKGDVLALVCENNINYCVPVLAALYMGVTINLLDPAYAIGELKHALGISKAKLILSSETAMDNILKIKGEFEFIKTIVLLGTRSENHPEIGSFDKLLEITKIDVENFEPESFDCSQQGAFILLSSGSTGLPKGVLLTHQNFRASMSSMSGVRFANISAEETTVLVLPCFHMFGLMILLASIASSMKLILLDKFEAVIFLRSIQDYQATKLFVVPSLLLFLSNSPLVDNYNISSIRDIIVGAAPIGQQQLMKATSRLANITIRLSYGSTEVSGACIFQTIGIKKPGSAGILMPGVTAKIWDANLNRNLGPLKTGELCFKGAMVMKGYFGDAAATRECIYEDGFYHSGDLGFYDQDGHIYIVDRIKELIKYKGFQVSPAELESLILTHPGVKECGVIGIPDERAGELPLAYVVLQNGANVTKQEIVDYVGIRISAEKHLYGGVVFIEQIPKTPTGKILRGKLRQMFLNAPSNVEHINATFR